MYQGFEYNLNLLLDLYRNRLKFYAFILVVMMTIYGVVYLQETYFTNQFLAIFLIIYVMFAFMTYLNIYYILNLNSLLKHYHNNVESVESRLRNKLHKFQHSLFRVNIKLYTYYSILYSNIKSKQ